jgi:cell division protein FtsB
VKILIGSLWILLLILQYPLWIGTGSFADVYNLQQQLKTQQQQLRAHQQRNQKLSTEIRSLQQQAGAIENRARYELSMVRQGETYIRLIRHE